MADGTITLDGRSIPFDKGDTIIMAARRVGLSIPHYCWHPGLSAPANCRMCLVDVEPPPGRPKMMLDILTLDDEQGGYRVVQKTKLMPACQMRCADGMVVSSESSDEVKTARAAVQELLLLNHPVDCPICDQAGECTLQDYWREHDRQPKRMLAEPVHKPKAVPFGDTIVYDAERCIMCTRCIRVCDELAGDPVLSLVQRGNRNEIGLAPGRRLDHAYTLMTEHVCPVGALTSTDFRFKARVWFLRSRPTICQRCATGCNAYLDYDPRTNTPYRYRPRENERVNKFWMCDEGMLSYRDAVEGRLGCALVGGEDATIDEALDAATKQLAGCDTEPDRLALVLSAEHCIEDNYALAVFGRRYLGVRDYYLARRSDGEADEVLRAADKNANSAGVAQVASELELGELGTMADLIGKLQDGAYRWAISLGTQVDVAPSDLKPLLGKLKGFVALASHEGPLTRAAHIALPVCAWAEAAGRYLNRAGIEQRTEAVLMARGDAYPGWQMVVALARALGFDLDVESDLRPVLAPAVTALAEATTGSGAAGAALGEGA